MKFANIMNETQGNCPRRDDMPANCAFVKTGLMLAVVLYHSVVYWRGGWFPEVPVYESRVLSAFAGWLNSFHVYSFTLVSGYLFAYLRFEKGKYLEYGAFIRKKASRLLLPYLIASLAWVIPLSVPFFHYSTFTVIKNYLLGISPSQLWFLLMLFDVFVLFYMFLAVFERNVFDGAVLSIIFYWGGYIGIPLFS